jgi:DNA-binding NarL/FixJ family response regulator
LSLKWGAYDFPGGLLILLLTRLSDGEIQDKAIMAGARGIIDYRISLSLFLNAMEKVHEGQICLTATLLVDFGAN